MTEQWQELKETIAELRDNDGTGTQQDVCKFLVNYMEILEKQMQEPILDKIRERISLEKLGYPPSAGYYKAIIKVLQIIDKYRTESKE